MTVRRIREKLANRITCLYFLIKDLFVRPLYINAYVGFVGFKQMKGNWGDDINYSFLKNITKRKISIYGYSILAKKRKAVLLIKV